MMPDNREPTIASLPALTRRANLVLWASFLLLLVWYASGALPFGGPQGDAIKEAAGVEHIARYGWTEPLLTHNFIGCPGLAVTLVCLRRLTGLDPLLLQGVLSLVSGIIYVLAAAGLVHRVTRLPVPLAGLVMLLSPIAIVAGMYPNDLVTAAALATLALFLFAGADRLGNQLAGAVCLGLAGWFRADAILIAGAIPFILYRGSARSLVRSLVLVGCVAAGLALGAVYASGSNVSGIIQHARTVTVDVGRPAQIAGFYVCFFPLIVFYLFVGGVVYVIRARQWRWAGMFLAGVVPLWCVNLTFPYPKYFTYVVPWFALACSCGLYALIMIGTVRRRRIHGAVLALLFCAQYVFGLHITLRDKPWRTAPEPVVARLVDHEFSSGCVDYLALVVGPGTINPFGHAGTPMTGILFTPLNMSREQRSTRDYLTACTAYVDGLTDQEIRFFSLTHDGLSSAMYALVNSGFRCVEMMDSGPTKKSWRAVWRRGNQRVIQYRVYTPGFNMRFLREIGELAGTYFVGSGAEEDSILKQAASARKVMRYQANQTRGVYEVIFPPLNADGTP